MHWYKRNLWKISIAFPALLLLLILLAVVPGSVANASNGVLASAMPGTATTQATPTVDATVTALTKEQLQHTNDWWWNYGATLLTSLISTFTLAAAGIFTVVRYFSDRRDAREKQEQEARRLADDRQAEQERKDEEQQRWLKMRQDELEKQAEERFQAVVTGLGNEKERAQVSAAILLRTFLRPDYERFYTQTFDLAVAHLRLPRAAHPSEGSTPLPPLTALNQALIGIFKEAFPLARSLHINDPQSLDATGIQLDHARLREIDLAHVWMPLASLRNVDLRKANLNEAHVRNTDFRRANLRRTDFRKADLVGARLDEADLSEAILEEAQLAYANLSKVKFNEVNLRAADLFKADLSSANIEDASSLKGTKLRGVKGLTKEQLEACKGKGAILDEDPAAHPSRAAVVPSPPSQSNNAHVPSAPSAQRNTLLPGSGGSSAASTQQGSEP